MDIHDLLNSVSLRDVRCLTVLADRVTDPAIGIREPTGGEGTVSIDVHPVAWGTTIETWFRLTVDLPDAKLAAAYATLFTRDSDEAIPEPVQVEFVERVAIMAVFPYLRESVHTSAVRLQVPPPVLDIMRQGTFRVNTGGGPTEPEAVDHASD